MDPSKEKPTPKGGLDLLVLVYVIELGKFFALGRFFVNCFAHAIIIAPTLDANNSSAEVDLNGDLGRGLLHGFTVAETGENSRSILSFQAFFWGLENSPKEEKRVCVSLAMGYSNCMKEISESQSKAIEAYNEWLEESNKEYDAAWEAAMDACDAQDMIEDAKNHGVH